jgi:hypothetical protein
MTIVLVDLSSIAHPIWHMSQSDPDPDATANGTVAKVHSLAAGQPHVAVCCDSGKSWRCEVSADYKANRPEREEALTHQIRLAEERLIEPLVEQIDPWGVRKHAPRPGAFSRATHAKQKKTPLPRRHEDAIIWPLINHAVIYTGKTTARLRDSEFGMKPERMRREPCLASLAVEKTIHAPGLKTARSVDRWKNNLPKRRMAFPAVDRVEKGQGELYPWTAGARAAATSGFHHPLTRQGRR